MAKKKAATKKAVKKVATKKVVKKKTAAKAAPKKSKVATKTKTTKKAKPVKKTVASVAPSKKKVVTKVTKTTVTKKPTTVVKTHPPKPVRSAWSISDIKVTDYDSDQGIITHFQYVRHNPVDCQVVVMYADSMGSPPNTPIGYPKDGGAAINSGLVRNWDSMEIIPLGYKVSLQLCLNGTPMTPAYEATVESMR